MYRGCVVGAQSIFVDSGMNQNPYYVTGIMLSAFMMALLNPEKTPPQGRFYYYPHFIHEEIKKPRLNKFN